ncbi:MAG: GNAT family N-acetyltransferase [Rhodobacter sp.]|uniref:GNAT family N-acetyltransferase n=1 Tax=Pararhodobacter sp. TaxID=2127056 RepID=UPI002CA816FA|nr:GNAT family N-acetyltransferase [Pararhodobacter sp.]MCC0071988.1 GNAT family N-acetyltransferase [Rhodobacter sp.]HPD92902.1 GNAT family N-acetyltransferase [Pararhodobacter sp.]
MTPDALAALHARTFVAPPPWSAASFAALLARPHVFLEADAQGRAFALGQVIAGEAELLTLATDPAHRRQGLARALLARFAASARQRGADSAFLEVAENNAAARALYAASGWTARGRRPGYYRTPGQPAVAALILCKSLA